MKPGTILVSTYMAALLAVTIATPTQPVAAQGSAGTPSSGNTYYYDFEMTLDPWSAQADSGLICSLERRSGDNGCDDKGTSYAQLASVLGSFGSPQDIPDPVATWIVTGLPAPRGQVQVSVEWSAKSRNDCAGCIPVVYVGSSPPVRGGQLRPAGPELSGSWHSYRYDTSLLVGGTGMVYIAIGWLGTDASIGIDCVSVSIGAR